MTNILPTEDHDLNDAIASAFNDLKQFSATDEGYQITVNQLTELYALKHGTAKIILEEKIADNKHTLDVDTFEHQLDVDALPFYKRMSPDAVLTVAGNLVLGLAVIKYEQRGVITSKVMTFMKKI